MVLWFLKYSILVVCLSRRVESSSLYSSMQQYLNLWSVASYDLTETLLKSLIKL